MSKEYYTLKIGGIERKLQKFPVSDKMDIAAFILFGDVVHFTVSVSRLSSLR